MTHGAFCQMPCGVFLDLLTGQSVQFPVERVTVDEALERTVASRQVDTCLQGECSREDSHPFLLAVRGIHLGRTRHQRGIIDRQQQVHLQVGRQLFHFPG